MDRIRSDHGDVHRNVPRLTSCGMVGVASLARRSVLRVDEAHRMKLLITVILAGAFFFWLLLMFLAFAPDDDDDEPKDYDDVEQ